jgi:DNA-binding IclR family transcriptional regulator
MAETVGRGERGSAIQRALAVLEGVAGADRPISATELNGALDLPKATVHRLCRMLEREGFLQRELDGKRFVPGPRLNRLALSVIAGSGLRAERHAILHAVSTEIGETCNVTVPDGSEMHYVDRVETHWPLRLQFPIGTRVPLHCTASGKLFLSSLPNARRKRLLTRLALDRRTARTLTEPATLEAALMRIRKEQLGTDDEEFVDGMVAVAVPVTDPRGRLIATLATHAPRQRMTLEAARRHLPALRRAAAQLSELLGGGDAE